ncbi:MAG: ATP-dependent RecD-like DNA helicase [Eubacterium sp.]|nr:ATP-dependent RecD-like DNA helicase [Eubacterium sp.]
MIELKGYVNHIVYRNDENGYTVLVLECGDDDDMTCVGTFPFIHEGDYVKVTGEIVVHPLYQEQLKVSSYEAADPDNEIAMLKYLSSGAIAGIRGGLAKRIVDKFGEKTFEIIEKEPERLAEVKGISEKKARDIAAQFVEKNELRNAIIFLQKFGITNTLAVKIHKQYGEKLYDVVRTEPYKMVSDIRGVGFRTADEIARKAGFDITSPSRIKAGIIYVLESGAAEGYVYMPEKELLEAAVAELAVNPDDVLAAIEDMEADKSLIVKIGDEKERRVYKPALYYAECAAARMLVDLDVNVLEDSGNDIYINKLEKNSDIILDDMQREAVREALNRGLLIITGGPGTGKTTTINLIIKALKDQGYSMLLAAPTGRAAKRMSEATGYEAQTIHRLLEYSGVPGEDSEVDDSAGKWNRNEFNPLETDVVIIDEMSMVDIYLFEHLLKAILPGTRLILVGDVNQLPSVGPGNVLRDIINSGRFNVVKLEKIFRQAAKSDIVMNAHRIHAGEEIPLDNKGEDFFCIRRATSHDTLEMMLYVVKTKLPPFLGCAPQDIQVLTPMRKGELGAIHCNEVLQKYLNPPANNKAEINHHECIFREGDKVMQIKNNYQIKYEIRGYHGVVIEEGTGVFNGDLGVIETIDKNMREVTVRFEDDKYITYPYANLDEIELAYAITVHKSQGSEYKAVVLPLLSGPRPLMTRNILYTAVTRGKSLVTIIGNPETVLGMIHNDTHNARYSSLCERIVDIG